MFSNDDRRLLSVIRANPIRTRGDWEQARASARANPGKFHGEIAKREIFWFERKLGAWIQRVDATSDAQRVDASSGWRGFDAETGAALGEIDLPPDHEPWTRAFNDDTPPFYRWFEGGLTNAGFNEVDAHVLAGHGKEVAFIFEGDRWDPLLENGRGGPVVRRVITRKELFWEVARHALVLKNLGLKKGDRIAINMPNIPEQIFFTEAAKRLGVIYTPVFGGFSAKTLSDRIHDAGAKVIITSDGAHRNAAVIPFKEAYTDRALDSYVPVSTALEIVEATLAKLGALEPGALGSGALGSGALGSGVLDAIRKAVVEALDGEITVERSDVMRGVGAGLTELTSLSAADKSRVRTALAEALVEPVERVQATLIVRHVKLVDLPWNPGRDRWAHELLADATTELLARAAVGSEAELLELSTAELVRAIYGAVPPVIVDAEFPLFIIYTSGSTGKPKGVVHTHGGYVAGLAHTMRVAFDVEPGDGSVIYVVADPGWITGQSYLISAALTTRTTSVVCEGSPLFPHAGRFASIIERNRVSIFKAGSTFLKSVAADPENIADVERYDRSSLRVATFCAEPTSPTVQDFGMRLLTPVYINSYWATEHGGIVLTHFFGNHDFVLRADAHTFALPWIFAEVWVPERSFTEGGRTRHEPRLAEPEEKGELVIVSPFPYLARTLWGDPDNVGKPEWRGDLRRFRETYFEHWLKPGSGGKQTLFAYTQGDHACSYSDGSLSLHGRSDEVINTGGHRIGTEEIEGAILKDKQRNRESPVGNVIVVGAPHAEKGTVPLAFVRTLEGRALSLDEERRLSELVREEKGAVAAPAGYICVSQFPETRSGKYMRRFLKSLLEGMPLGDTTALSNPEALTEARAAITAWRTRQELEDEQRILEVRSALRIEYHQVAPGARFAIVIVDKPPVNALDERALDELDTTLEHLARRSEIKAVILTGAGTRSFVAGADIRQLLEEMHSPADVLPLSNKARQAMRRLETLDKPTLASINGAALGGGNEFQMAAHYRIAESTARFAQPEIALSLIPGYGGTQRLPRLIEAKLGEAGLVEAQGLILGGRAIDAERALALGLIDEIAESDALSRATELVREYILTGSGRLGKAMRARLELCVRWEQPRALPASFESHPETRRLVAQARHAGRERAAALALEAIRVGYERGMSHGLSHETRLFAEAVVSPSLGKRGIRAFFDKTASALAARHLPELDAARAEPGRLVARGLLLPVGSPFFPGVTPLPEYQYAQLVERDRATGEARHGDPRSAEVLRIVPVGKPRANEALVFMLTSEINFNDIWAITGVPVSPLDQHDEDWHVTGSGGLGLVAALGTELKAEGRLKVGDLVAVFSGQSELLSPLAGLDPMFADQRIQGYETPDGSHQQFIVAQGPQLFHKLPDLTLEAAGSYLLNLGTIYRALFTTLRIAPGKTLFVEGAATGTGLEAVKAGSRNRVRVAGMVSSAERAATVCANGGVFALNRSEPGFAPIFRKVPEDPAEWSAWEREGEGLLEAFRGSNGGALADYALSHAGETLFPRSFQLLALGGVLSFYGASSGYHFTFMGKPGALAPQAMLARVVARAGHSVLVFYGSAQGPVLDPTGVECIEAAAELGARVAVCAWTAGQRECVKSMGFGTALKGVFSLEEIQRKEGERFVWPETMPPLPNPRRETAAFREAVRWYQEHVFKPFATALGRLLRAPDNPRGQPDLVVERARQDTLCLSTMLVKPHTGRVAYCEDMSGRRYSFYAPQVWMRQRRIDMPSASIWGTHLNNAYEMLATNDLVHSGLLAVGDPAVIEFGEIAQAHQEMWENRHRAANYVLNHALPRLGLKTKDELYQAWSLSEPVVGR